MNNNLLVATLVLVSSAYAQTPNSMPPPHRVGLGPVGFGHGPGSHKVVSNAPYSADMTDSSVQTLADGNTISHTFTGHVARDNQGRTYLQETRGEGPFNSSGSSVMTFISDPVAGYTYVLNANTKVAMRRVFKAPTGEGASPMDAPRPSRQSVNDAERVETDLGQQSINGLTAHGKSVTRTVPAGAIGNAQPIVEKSEVWTSPDLQVVVLSKRTDPRIGQTTYSLTNIQRMEPKSSLFQVPSDYTVQDAQSWHRRD